MRPLTTTLAKVRKDGAPSLCGGHEDQEWGEVCSEISLLAQLAMIAGYLFLAPRIHRLPSLGAQ